MVNEEYRLGTSIQKQQQQKKEKNNQKG